MIKNMNNKGFIYIETIVTVVILLTTLVLLYSMYSRVIIREKEKLYYDDMAYIYKTISIKDILNSNLTDNFNTIKENTQYLYILNENDNIYENYEIMNNIQDFYHINNLIYMKIANLSNVKKCLKDQDDSNECTNIKINVSKIQDLKEYLLSLNVPNEDDKYNNSDSILISVISEAKNGEEYTALSYDECLKGKVKEYYNLPNVSSNDLDNYYKSKNVKFDMACEKATYISWVYL